MRYNSVSGITVDRVNNSLFIAIECSLNHYSLHPTIHYIRLFITSLDPKLYGPEKVGTKRPVSVFFFWKLRKVTPIDPRITLNFDKKNEILQISSPGLFLLSVAHIMLNVFHGVSVQCS